MAYPTIDVDDLPVQKVDLEVGHEDHFDADLVSFEVVTVGSVRADLSVITPSHITVQVNPPDPAGPELREGTGPVGAEQETAGSEVDD